MEDVKLKYFTARMWALFSGIVLTLVFSWFVVNQYLNSIPVAEENLRALALSLSAAVEAVAGKDTPPFPSLSEFQTPDVAFMEILDRRGAILYHTNSALIGGRVSDGRFEEIFKGGAFSGDRILLGTGEEIFESNAPMHVRGELLALRLGLHTYRADSVIRRARAGMVVSFSLLAAAWILGILLHRYAMQAEIHRREMARREQMARMGEMGAVIAHEIRNPLAGIKGYAQLLLEKHADGNDGRFAELIVTESVRLEEMVNELLEYSRSDYPPSEPVNLQEVIARSMEIIAPEAEAAAVIVERSLDDFLTVQGNRDSLEQLILNLARNAIQAMPNGGILGIKAQCIEKGVKLLVTDSGTGITPENLQRVFEPFFTTKARGTGLGLAICRKIIEDYNGRIDIESRPGKGTSVGITFPRAKGSFRSQ